ncbi:MAG: radical SAM protein [Bdellovibrionales bacterium]|nr:radical SAM protein [Bdellovibrionales bacterium]
MDFYVGLSTNGTFIDPSNIDKIAELNFNYVGISLDGIGETHNRFRRKASAFKATLEGIHLCKSKDLKVDIRFTITQENRQDLPALLKFQKAEHIDRFYSQLLEGSWIDGVFRGVLRFGISRGYLFW